MAGELDDVEIKDNSFTMPAGDVTVQAVFEPDSYMVMLDTNGGTIDNRNIDSYTYGTSAILSTADDMIYTGFQFAGWYEQSDFSGTPTTEISSTDAGDKAFYAKWEWTTTTIDTSDTINYIIEHCKASNGGYTLVDTKHSTGTIGDTVTATPKTYAEKLYRELGGNHLKKLIILFVLTLCFVLTGCNQTASSQGDEPSAPQESQEPSSAVTTPSADKSSQESSDSSGAVTTSPAQKPDELIPSAIEQTATLYIGTKVKGFTEYPMAYEGDLTPEMLIQGIADLTGWNLTLAEPVISGKGGMSVCLSKKSALFNGPPDPQKEEFFMFGLDDLAETLLDSIQKTLQEGFTLENGDPDTLDIWYYMEGEQPLELPGLGLSWPLDQPYQWSGAQIMEK